MQKGTRLLAARKGTNGELGLPMANSENRWESKGVTRPFVVDQSSETIRDGFQAVVTLLFAFPRSLATPQRESSVQPCTLDSR